jgi:hypothetical protein
VIEARQEQRPTTCGWNQIKFRSMELLDTRLKQVEMQLQRNQEEDMARREQIFKELRTRCFQCGQVGHFTKECSFRNSQAKQCEQKLQPVNKDS